MIKMAHKRNNSKIFTEIKGELKDGYAYLEYVPEWNVLVDEYYRASLALVDAMKHWRGVDAQLTYPALFVAKSYLELELKCLSSNLEKISNGKAKRNFGHNLQKIFSEFVALTKKTFDGGLGDFYFLKAFVYEFQDDPRGDLYRYSRDGKGNKTIFQNQCVNLLALRAYLVETRRRLKILNEWLVTLHSFREKGNYKMPDQKNMKKYLVDRLAERHMHFGQF